MIIDETAGSGGDLLPWMFRKFGLGKLVGKRTWGGLVGILGFPVLMDGGVVTAPDLAIFTEDGWVVENVGVPPDIEVEQDPALVAAGKDPQLDRAIEVILAELEKNPPPKPPARPPFPVARARVAAAGRCKMTPEFAPVPFQVLRRQASTRLLLLARIPPMPKKVAVFWPGDYRAKPNEWALAQSQEATAQLTAALREAGAIALSGRGLPHSPR